MQHRGLSSVFVKLFASVMLALTLFAIAMVSLTQMVHDKDATIRSQVLATQILSQVDPFLEDLNKAAQQNNRLQARFMLAVVKKSFDIFDDSLQAKMGLYDQEGHLLMQTDNSDLPQVLPERPSWLSRAFPFLSDTPSQQVQVYSNTGYILLFESRLPPKKPVLSAALNLFTGTLLLLCIMAGVLWWIARSMTWRINQLSQQMDQLGDGDFSARVTVRGNDEIAALAKGFNQAAKKIEHLINANNLLLAHASHELRTPITRIRLQIEMMDMLASKLDSDTKAKFDKRATAVNRDLTALNDLVESILLVSRLDAGHALQQVELLDLYDLVNQECQHYPQALLFGEHLKIEGQPQLLTHLIRNLLNNAVLHGVPPVTVMLYGSATVEQAGVIPESLVQSILTHSIEPQTEDMDLLDAAFVESNERLEHQKASSEQTHISAKPETSNIETSPVSSASLTETNADSAVTTTGIETSVIDSTVGNSIGASADADSVKSVASNDTSLADNPRPQETISAAWRRENPFKKHLRRYKSDEPVLPPNFAVLAVIDEGKGIPLDKREDIFSPFVRLQQKKKGSGLGLSLVSQIVTAHQGRITTDTINGHTRFLVVLPVNSSHSALPPLEAISSLPVVNND
ncbi:MAG: HAMP domain-containing sensor histidine kinase [Psychrobacter sp.]|nr:HAMP domain-containing sensor histidine kinase [Psychrobacter sp.]